MTLADDPDDEYAMIGAAIVGVHLFNAIKHYRSIGTRYDKTARNFFAGLHLVRALTGSNDDRALIRQE